MRVMQTVVCMKWGDRYPSDFVNRLHSMVMRNVTRPTRLVCYTDDSSGIVSGVDIRPLPEISLPDAYVWTPWRKLSLWRDDLPDLSGDILFIDLDMVIVDNIDVFFDYRPGSYCVIENWTQRGRSIGNTSLFRFPFGVHGHIFDLFDSDPERYLSRYRIEQQYISGEIDEQHFWPRDWCLSFKHDLVPNFPLNYVFAPRLPFGSRIVAFTGRPDPDDALLGVWPESRLWKRLYKRVRPTSWIGEHWR